VEVVKVGLAEGSDEGDDGPELLHDLVGGDGFLLGLGVSESSVDFSDEFDDSGEFVSWGHLF